MSIVTKTGDKGETSLMYGRRVPKGNPRVQAYGAVDELTATLGLARAITTDKPLAEHVLSVQKDLIIVMGELATSQEDRDRYLNEGFKVTNPELIDRLTSLITEFEKDPSLYPKDWVIPGATPTSAALDLARTVCRRAERQVAALPELNPEILRYLNRLSDLCWILGRYAEKNSPS